jgi:hypothetical protein
MALKEYTIPHRQQFLLHFHFLFFKLTPICNLSCVANQTNTFSLVEILLFHNLDILLLVTPLNVNLLYIDLVE